MPDIMIKGFRCTRCDHEWVPHRTTVRPTLCPKCKSPYWDKSRQERKESDA